MRACFILMDDGHFVAAHHVIEVAPVKVNGRPQPDRCVVSLSSGEKFVVDAMSPKRLCSHIEATLNQEWPPDWEVDDAIDSNP